MRGRQQWALVREADFTSLVVPSFEQCRNRHLPVQDMFAAQTSMVHLLEGRVTRLDGDKPGLSRGHAARLCW